MRMGIRRCYQGGQLSVDDHFRMFLIDIDDDIRIVRIYIDHKEMGRYRKPAGVIIGDATQALRALLARLPRHNVKRQSRDEEIEDQRAWLSGMRAMLEPQVAILHAMRAVL